MARAPAAIVYAEDCRLARDILRGEEAAFRQFFDEHYARLYRFALSRLAGNENIAEDIVQKSLSKALQRLSGYKGESQLHTWLCAICRNDIADWYRAQGRYEQRVVLAEDLPGMRAAIDSFRAPESDSPENRLQRSEAVRLIQVALDNLPRRYGNVLEWKYIEGYSSREIAERMGIGYEAAQSLLARAKRAFAAAYGELAGEAAATGGRRE